MTLNRRRFLNRAALSSGAVYLPLVVNDAEAAPADQVPTPRDIDMPFTVLDSVQPDPVQRADGYWYAVVYRVDAGAANGGWVVRWRLDSVAEAVQQVTRAAATVQDATPLPGPLSPARGSLAEGRDGRLYYFGWLGTTGRTTVLRMYAVN